MQLGKILPVLETHVFLIMDSSILFRLYNYSLCLFRPPEKGFLQDLGDRRRVWLVGGFSKQNMYSGHRISTMSIDSPSSLNSLMGFSVLSRLWNYSLCLSTPPEKVFLPDLLDESSLIFWRILHTEHVKHVKILVLAQDSCACTKFCLGPGLGILDLFM